MRACEWLVQKAASNTGAHAGMCRGQACTCMRPFTLRICRALSETGRARPITLRAAGRFSLAPPPLLLHRMPKCKQHQTACMQPRMHA